MRTFIIAGLTSTALTLSACGGKTNSETPVNDASPKTAVASSGEEDFRTSLQRITNPDELLEMLDKSGGMAANLKNLQISDRMAELMEEKFQTAQSAGDLYRRYRKYAIRGRAEIVFNNARHTLEERAAK